MRHARYIVLLIVLSSIAACAQAGEIAFIPFVRYEANQKYMEIDRQGGWTTNFLDGAPEEGGRLHQTGELKAEITKPNGPGPFPLVVLLHGCSGAKADIASRMWSENWTKFFLTQGVGVLALDSFATRNVKEACGKPAQYWARRRVDDAYSALDYLVEKDFALADSIFVMGMSNGARTVLNVVSLGMQPMRKNHFAGAIALYPNCIDQKKEYFYAPLWVFVAGSDDSNPPAHCRELEQFKRPPTHPEVQVFEYPGAFHLYDIDRPYRVSPQGWRYGYNRDAALDTQRRIGQLLASSLSAHRVR